MRRENLFLIELLIVLGHERVLLQFYDDEVEDAKIVSQKYSETS